MSSGPNPLLWLSNKASITCTISSEFTIEVIADLATSSQQSVTEPGVFVSSNSFWTTKEHSSKFSTGLYSTPHFRSITHRLGMSLEMSFWSVFVASVMEDRSPMPYCVVNFSGIDNLSSNTTPCDLRVSMGHFESHSGRTSFGSLSEYSSLPACPKSRQRFFLTRISVAFHITN